MLKEIEIPEAPKDDTLLYGVREYPDDMLKERAQAWVQDVQDPRFQQLIDGLEATMMYQRALGLAGPQIGVPYRILAIRQGQKALTMVNPRITKLIGDITSGEEGCLSFPGLFIKVKRVASVEVQYMTRTGESKTERFTGQEARAVQHEVDHLDGKVFIDRIPKVLRSEAMRKWRLAPRVVKQQNAKIQKILEQIRAQAPKAPVKQPEATPAPVESPHSPSPADQPA